ncbi:D-alanyl-D-alanine carboxypeptidase/D-alanyl-D-alanine-endopeptidase [Thiomicrospira sp. WB1]|uniref:D-alanyl-D-alanine carboxypeptidase/D-alanyl-D-alanine-endopeptidase n=1 Tax=Thiomicrospira sp. WB1 TaxID=1685380 RepID=UPI00128F5B44|nr:D-alanyl-D-alanine carboxypeptidase [Thiomicrospira sp. WB1]
MATNFSKWIVSIVCAAGLFWVAGATQLTWADQSRSLPGTLVSSDALSVWTAEAGAISTVWRMQDQVPRIPASTVKLITALLALETWSPDHRFHTDVHLQSTERGWELVVKGYGDPFLVSETLATLAARLTERLKQKGIGRIERLVLDDGYFDVAPETVPGLSQTDNPYDALPTALMANFNTLKVRREDGRIRSGEPQTPLTALAASIASERLPADQAVGRINLGQRPERSAVYFGQLLQTFLAREDVTVQSVSRRTPDSVALSENQAWSKTPFLRFENPKPLAEQVRAMLKYSTNLIAHHLILKLSAERFGPPATMASVRRYLSHALKARFGWAEVTVYEGAGLSRQNRLSARQLGQVLNAFAPWRSLLPQERTGVWAKTGTLQGVRTLAGYVCPTSCDQSVVPFVWLLNDTGPLDARWQFAQRFRRALQTGDQALAASTP